MNAVHLHLVITHLPIFGSLLGAIVLLYGLKANQANTLHTAYLLFSISAPGATAAYLTGEGAGEAVEQLQELAESTIEAQEGPAKYILTLTGLSGISSTIAFIINYKNPHNARTIAKFILVLSLISFGFSAYTGWLGGKIRHTELIEQVQHAGEE